MAVDPPEVPGYLVTRPLGFGSGGPVWAATRIHDRTAVAIKVVGGAGRAGSSSAELAASRGLRHPHVVQLVEDVALPDGSLALVLELVRGGSLARVVQARGHLTPAETVTVVTALATTLADLHEIGLTHGDLAPGNVLFHPDGRPALADLGVARITAAAGSGIRGGAGRGAEREVWGTAGFVDPAVLAGAVPGPAADVYALGALGWYCLVGEPPAHPAVRPSLGLVCPSVPAPLVAAVEAALEPDPVRRVSPADLARAAYAAGPPAPVQLASGDDPVDALTHRIRALAVADPAPTPRRGRRLQVQLRLRLPLRAPSQVPRRTLIWAGLSVALAVLATAGALVLRPPARAVLAPPRPTRPPVATLAAAPVSWSKVVAALALARDAAFSDPDRGRPRLAGFDVPGSPAARHDQTALDTLWHQGLRYAGLRLQVGPVSVLADDDEGARLALTVWPSAYDVVDRAGTVRRRVAAGRPAAVTIELRATADGWRVSDVR